MTKQEALIQIAQALLRVRGADVLVQHGMRPNYDQISVAVREAADLLDGASADDRCYARVELDRRYTPAIVPYPAIVDEPRSGHYDDCTCSMCHARRLAY